MILALMRPLVILHGLFGSSRNWQGISKKLTTELLYKEIYPIDLRNHNLFHNSKATTGEIESWRTLQNDLELYWKTELKGQDFDLLGHSYGGQVSMSSVLRKDSILREAVKKLIIVDVSLRHPSADKSDKDDHLHQLMMKMIEINSLKLVKRSDVINELKKVEQNENVINFLLLNLTKDGDIFAFGNLGLKHLEDAWKRLKMQWTEGKSSFVPWEGETLFLKGELSDYIKESDLNEIKKFFPNSKIETISKSGHWPHFDNQTEFINKVIKFL